MASVCGKVIRQYCKSLHVDDRIPKYMRTRLDDSLSAYSNSMPIELIAAVELAAEQETANIRNAWEQFKPTLRQQLYRLPNILEHHNQIFQQYAALQQGEQQKLYDRVLFCSEQSDASCEVCQQHHGEIFTPEELARHDLIPPLHPNCRCKLVAMDSTAEMIYNRDRYWFLNTVSSVLEKQAGSAFQLRPEFTVFGISHVTLTGLALPNESFITECEEFGGDLGDRFVAWPAKFGNDAADFLDAFIQRGQNPLHHSAEVFEENPILGTLLFLDAASFGIVSGIMEGNTIRWNVMLEDFNLYTLANYLTMGTTEMLHDTFEPEEFWSFEHVMNIIGTLTLIYTVSRGVRARQEQSQGLGNLDDGWSGSGDYLERVAGELDDQLDDIAREYGDIVSVVPADELNDFYLARNPTHQAPYWPGTTSYQMQLAQEMQFVHLYGGHTDQVGHWLMRADDIAGLSPQQIQGMFSLPQVPSYICDVTIPAGTILEVSGASAILSGAGGGIQFYIIERPLEQWFSNFRSIN